MTRDHRVEDIASQAELSKATVDRVLHGRPRSERTCGSSGRSRPCSISTASETQLRLGARTVVLDVIVQAPQRFSTAYREAVEAQLGSVRPAAVRARFRFAEHADAEAAVAALDQVGARGRDLPRRRCSRLPTTPRSRPPYADWRTAAYPSSHWSRTSTPADGSRTWAWTIARPAPPPHTSMARWLGDRRGDLLVTLSRYGVLRRERALHRLP